MQGSREDAVMLPIFISKFLNLILNWFEFTEVDTGNDGSDKEEFDPRGDSSYHTLIELCW